MSTNQNPPKKLREAQKEATRERLLRVAERVFTQHGFDQVSVAMVCRAARVTHGALYHHFPTKLELFAAVFARLSEEVAQEVRQAAAGVAGWHQVEASCEAYLDACATPGVQAILLRDGPRVLPPERQRVSGSLIEGLLQGWAEAGLLRPLSVGLLGRVLEGAFSAASAAMLTAPNQRVARAELGALFRLWLGTLRPSVEK